MNIIESVKVYSSPFEQRRRLWSAYQLTQIALAGSCGAARVQLHCDMERISKEIDRLDELLKGGRSDQP